MAGGKQVLIYVSVQALIVSYRHIFTGIAQFYNLTWSIWLRYCFDGDQDVVELVWPTFFTSIPLVERTDRKYKEPGRRKTA